MATDGSTVLEMCSCVLPLRLTLWKLLSITPRTTRFTIVLCTLLFTHIGNNIFCFLFPAYSPAAPERNNEVLSKLRKSPKYPVPYSRTNRYQPFLNYALVVHFQKSK